MSLVKLKSEYGSGREGLQCLRACVRPAASAQSHAIAPSLGRVCSVRER